MLLEQREQQLYADYNQVYVQDSNAPGNTGDPAFWTERAFSDKLAFVDGIIGIGTVTYGDVRVRSEVHDSAPQFDLALWDHVTEASLDVRGRTIRITGCLDPEGENFAVRPGSYRVRCCHSSLAAAVEEEGMDWYLVQIWPASHSAAVVLKRWTGGNI